MLEYNRMDMSEGIDVNKTNEPHRCIILTIITFLKKVLDFSMRWLSWFTAKGYKF